MGLFVDYHNVFLKLLGKSHSDGTHALAEDPFMSSNVSPENSQICFDEETNSSTSCWPEGVYILSKFLFLVEQFL